MKLFSNILGIIIIINNDNYNFSFNFKALYFTFLIYNTKSLAITYIEREIPPPIPFKKGEQVSIIIINAVLFKNKK